MKREFSRLWTCAAPAIVFGLPIALLARPWIGIIIFCGVFGFGWSMTKPRAERGESR
jgi:hypothetical protein